MTIPKLKNAPDGDLPAECRLSGPVLSRLSDLSYLFALACRRNSAQTTAVAIATLSDSEPLRSAG